MNDDVAREFLAEQGQLGRVYATGTSSQGPTAAFLISENGQPSRPVNPVDVRREIEDFLRRRGHPIEWAGAVESAMIRLCRPAP